MPHQAFLQHLGTKPKGEPLDLSGRAQELLSAYRGATPAHHPSDAQKLHVSDVVSTFAGIYERVRNAVEYHEEHLLRKNAMERTLRRKLLFAPVTGGIEPRRLAESLILDLIRGGYLPNDELPETEIDAVAGIIRPYLILLAEAKAQQTAEVGKGLDGWIVSLLANDIEQHLVPSLRARVLVDYAFGVLNKDLRWRGFESLTSEERDVQLTIAIERALLRADDSMIRHLLFHKFVPNWTTLTDDGVRGLAKHLATLRRGIEHQIRHPLGDAILRVVKKSATVFLVLKDVLESAEADDPEILADGKKLNSAITKLANDRYRAVKSRINRSVFRAVIYIFLTKAVLAFAVEFPYQLFVKHTRDYLPLIINVVFHPFFLFVIAASVQIPVKKNAERLTTIIRGLLLSPDQRNIVLDIREPRRGVLTVLYRIFYAITFFISFGVLIWFLQTIGFNGVSIFIFLFFISIISFFGIRIRQTTRELIVIEEKENFLTTLVDLFTVPVLQVGRWISMKAPKVNVLIFFLDYVLEAPLKSLLRVIEEWFSFLREKKEEVY